MNIGIHFFDLLLWLFGDVKESEVHLSEPQKMAGSLGLERANATWYLSIDGDDLPEQYPEKGQPAHRSMIVDGEEVDFSAGMTDLHTLAYQDAISGNGFGIEDARPSIALVHSIRNSEIRRGERPMHPILAGRKG
jgi:UDP-N-acetyl-2-amino-2-deoxyglucuronate dehydrogenase